MEIGEWRLEIGQMLECGRNRVFLILIGMTPATFPALVGTLTTELPKTRFLGPVSPNRCNLSESSHMLDTLSAAIHLVALE